MLSSFDEEDGPGMQLGELGKPIELETKDKMDSDRDSVSNYKVEHMTWFDTFPYDDVHGFSVSGLLYNVVYMYEFYDPDAASATTSQSLIPPESADPRMPPNNKAPMHWIVNVLTTAGSLTISLGVTLIGEFV
jgi:hypothetical protein